MSKQKIRRGRPRSFDEKEVLAQIMELFWERGYSATSLDQITEATGLPRPSLYGAFGSKKDIYFKALDTFVSNMEVKLATAAIGQPDTASRLKAICAAAIDIYIQPQQPNVAHGCFVLSTLPAEAENDPDFKLRLSKLMARMDQGFVLALGKKVSDPLQTAQIISLTLHGISIRARAGEPAQSLKNTINNTIDKLLQQKS